MKTTLFAVLLLSAYTAAIVAVPNAGHWVVAAALLLVGVVVKFRKRRVDSARVADELTSTCSGIRDRCTGKTTEPTICQPPLSYDEGGEYSE